MFGKRKRVEEGACVDSAGDMITLVEHEHIVGEIRAEAERCVHQAVTRAVGSAVASAVFSTLLYDPRPESFELAIKIGTDAEATGLLDVSHTYLTHDCWIGLTGTLAWKDERIMSRLFDLIIANGGRRMMNDRHTSSTSNDADIPVVAAVRNGATIIAERLAAHPETEINYRTPQKKNTALILAVQKGLVNTIFNLLHRLPELDLDITDLEGKTAADHVAALRVDHAIDTKSANGLTVGNIAIIQFLFRNATQKVAQYRAALPSIINSFLFDCNNPILPKVLASILFSYLNLQL